ncbi:predicted protein [Naegleria gruberi]|uniref:Poly [ADP-ribose] polymerase n=1 Tax=Naegleria gruberi TaxID=5762 RepID=D2VHV0_NAEGR|nr:uncharacterized protein NAEGRDRAFT_80022 [Naegleria gruberi]EFC43740.1 predicted protein [Naegleria gruberi]|eukprot:XP_002676484.1 predicted protein [Naegleria gruberi strain NEG-M]
MSSELANKIQREINEWKEAFQDDYFNLDDPWVRRFNFKSDDEWIVTCQADLDYSESYETKVSITIPKSYPTGEHICIVAEESHDIPGENIQEVLSQVFHMMKVQREKFLEEIPTPTPGTSHGHGDHIFGGDDDMADEEAVFIDDSSMEDDEKRKRFESIEHDLTVVRKTKGWLGCRGASGMDQIKVYLFTNPNRLNITPLLAEAWQLDLEKWICITITFSNYYTESATKPVVEAFQCGDVSIRDAYSLIDNGKVKFGLYWTVQQRLERDFFAIYWPIEQYRNTLQPKTGKNYMEYLLEYTESIIKTSPSKCLICGNKLPLEGIKPMCCESPLCIFSHEQYGLGIDLESAIKKNPDVVDLFVSVCYAASVSYVNRGFNPFQPFPSNLEIKLRDKTSGQVKTYNFLTNDGKDDNAKVREVLDKVPNLKILEEWVDEGKLKERCDEKHPLVYPLLRWILASARVHMKKLVGKEQLSEMKTDHQYILLSSTPDKERRFQELKKKYGSILAFHGSALGNWHSIMRKGLLNLSNTGGMVNGAAYGAGVYLAGNANVSFGYMRYQSGWNNSITFKSNQIGCLALCEILKAPELIQKYGDKMTPNPYFVIPNEEHLQTRAFFIYTTNQNHSVEGKDLKLPNVSFN